MLEIQHLSTDFETENGMVHAVRDVSLSVDKGEVLGIVGESGSGKSQTMFSVMGLLSGNGIVKDGSITIDGKEISPKAFSERKEYEQVMDHIRGNDLAMIFQDPMTFLNPVLRIETQLMEPILNHMDISKEEAKKRAIELMRKVGIPSPEARIRQYPHQFSGGMRQRIVIAIALACDPNPDPCRRAHHRTGCDHSGPDPAAAQGDAGQVQPDHRPHHPRSGRGGQHRRPGGRHVRR